jgi:hypothetical protein
MRKSSSCVVTLRRFGIWRTSITVVAVTALAALAAWAAAMSGGPPSGTPVLATALILAFGAIALALSLGRVERGVLSCHDGRWAFAPERQPERPLSGDLRVAVDLGSFLLLTLDGVAMGGRRCRRWVPVQRRGLEGDWHALRCAVYSPPLVATDALAANETPS